MYILAHTVKHLRVYRLFANYFDVTNIKRASGRTCKKCCHTRIIANKYDYRLLLYTAHIMESQILKNNLLYSTFLNSVVTFSGPHGPEKRI